MTGSQAVLGASTTTAGVAILPNTGGNTLLTVLSIITIAAGCAVMLSFALTRLATRFSR